MGSVKGALDELRAAVGGGYVYLASPYTGYPKGLEEAFLRVTRAAGELIAEGIPTFCPIAHSHVIAEHGELPKTDHAIWMPADRPLMDGAKALCVLMMDGWERSVGVTEERQVFHERGKPIFLMADRPYYYLW